MKYDSGMGSSNQIDDDIEEQQKMCFIWDPEIKVGNHVGTLLDNSCKTIFCWEFHIFHISCLTEWVMWNYYSTWCETETLVPIDGFFCTECGVNVDGNKVYSDEQVYISSFLCWSYKIVNMLCLSIRSLTVLFLRN
jgi:hypothetical protein